MDFFEALEKRRSIRKYKDGVRIPDDDMKKILAAAMVAPSACNTRPWEFIIAESDSVKAALAEIKPQAKTASRVVVVCALPDCQSGISEGYWQQDCGAAIENMLLAATALGYGSCWCGIYPRTERVELLKKSLGVISTPLAVVTFGVADESPEQRGFYDEKKVTVK